MVTNRKEYMRQYARQRRARLRGGEPGDRVHLACDRQIAELRQELAQAQARIREFEEIDGWGR
jgi:hypothetical protein